MAAADVFTTLQQNVWYLPTRDGAARLYVTELGRGTPVVVLHGGPGNDFNYLIDALRPHLDHYRFILLEQRGSLLSPVAPEKVASLTLAALVDDLELLRAALGEERLLLFGHSWGTFLGMAYFREHPEHVGGMVLAATAPPRAVEGASFLDTIHAAHARMPALRERPEVGAALDAAGARADTPQARSINARIQNAALNVWHVDRWRAYHGGGVYYNDDVGSVIGDSIPLLYDTVAVLATHPVPVTVLQGDHDYLDPAATTWRQLSPAPATVEVEVLPGAGHYSWIDAPDAFRHAFAHGLERAAR